MLAASVIILGIALLLTLYRLRRVEKAIVIHNEALTEIIKIQQNNLLWIELFEQRYVEDLEKRKNGNR